MTRSLTWYCDADARSGCSCGDDGRGGGDGDVTLDGRGGGDGDGDGDGRGGGDGDVTLCFDGCGAAATSAGDVAGVVSGAATTAAL